MGNTNRGFLRRFFLLCARTNLKKSDDEERGRYGHHPYTQHVRRWANIRFRTDEEDNDERE